MRITIEIPPEFLSDYTQDKFQDFFSRVTTDIVNSNYDGMCGNYEVETAQMLEKAFQNSQEV